MFYLLHGNDEFSCREQLKKLRQQGDFEYNQDTYAGGEVDLKTITATCSSLPFLTDQRLVVVMGLPKKRRGEDTAASDSGEVASPANAVQVGADSSRPAPIDRPLPEKSSKSKKGKKGAKSSTESRAGFEKGLAEYVHFLPDSTVLVVVVDEELSASSTLLKAAQEHGKVMQYPLPRGAAVKTWIENRARSSGVKITPEAVSMLADYIGNQLRLLANELDKLATYAGGGATIDADDVRKLSPQVQEARVFDLTDALAERNRKKALDLLHDLLADGEPPLQLIIERIQREGPLPFAEYMRMALYEPGYGYYVTGAAKMGWEGDYFTSTDVSTLFANCMGRQLYAMWEKLKRPPEFLIVEEGAGRGHLAEGVQAWAQREAPDFLAVLDYQVEDIRSGQDVLGDTLFPSHPQGTREGYPYHTTKPPIPPVYGRGTPRGYPGGEDGGFPPHSHPRSR